MTWIPNRDFNAEVVRGAVPGVAIMKGIGERESMGTTAAGEDIWRGNELSPAPTSHVLIPTPGAAGEQMTLVSESAQDDHTAGTGVWTVRIEYIDAAGAEQTEDIDLDGTTPVNTVATDIRFVNDMYSVDPIGTGGVAADHIKIYKTGTVGLVYNMIALGGNKSLVPHRMVPAGKELVLMGWHCEEAPGKRGAVRIRSTDMNGVLIPGVFCFKDVAYLNKSVSGDLAVTASVPALSIVKVSGWPDATPAEAGCSWWGYLFDV